MNDSSLRTHGDVRALVVSASFVPAFVMSQFYRSALAVIAPELATELRLDPESLGLAAGAFFVAIAAMQIPVGILLDRFGPRRITPSLMLIVVAGAAIFAGADGLVQLALGQALMGIGCAGIFMGGLVCISRWFTPDRFSSMGAALVATGTVGMLISATPFAWVTDWMGWRGAYLAVAGVTAVFALVVFVLARDAPPDHAYHRRRPESVADIARSLVTIARNRDLQRLFVLSFVAYGAVFAVRGLWGGPYLAEIHDLGSIARGDVLLFMSLGTIAGLVIYGQLDRHIGMRKPLILTGGAVSVLALVLLAILPAPAIGVVAVLFAVLGVSGAYIVLLLAHGRELFAEHLVGRAITTVNFANFVGVGVLQIVTGFVLGLFDPVDGHPPAAGYRTVFAVIGLSLLGALFVYRRFGEGGNCRP